MEQRVGLQGKLVEGEVRRLQVESRLEIGQRLVDGLTGQAEHQVQVDLFESGLVCHARGVLGVLPSVDAAELAQVFRREALHAQREPVDAGLPVTPEALALRRPRVRLQGDFRPGGDLDPRADARQQGSDGFRTEQAGRAAADEDRLDHAIRDGG